MLLENHSLIISTKLNRPRVPGDLVVRPQLFERLNRLQPLTLITAPAGYGKSTLLSSWLDSLHDTPAAWLSLESSDDNLAIFLHYVVKAVQTMFPAFGSVTITLLSSVDFPPTRVLLTTLVNELNQIAVPYVLVLDDYHLIKNVEIHRLMEGLLTHAPSTLHLALASRTDPLLPVQKYRAQNMVVEIRANDLRFSMTETALFLHNSVELNLNDRMTAEIYERSEGWVTGLHLAALSLRRAENMVQLSKMLNKDNRFIVEYLMSEVLASQTVAVQEWLLKTAVFDRFCPNLCSALLDETTLDGKQFINYLTANNLFTIALDDDRRWVRYHHLFGAFLKKEAQQRYTNAEITAVHTAGSRWLAKNRFYEEALHHALAAGDMAAAADLVETNARSLLDADQWYTLEQWLMQLPDDIIHQRPMLLLAKAWTAYHHVLLWMIPPLLEIIADNLDDGNEDLPLWGEVDFFWGHDAYWRGENNLSLQHLSRALQRIPKTHLMARGNTELFWGLAMQMGGREEEAVIQIETWLYFEQTVPLVRWAELIGTLIFIHLLSGKFTEAALEIQQLHEAAVKGQNKYLEAWSSYLMGLVHYYRNEMDTAVLHFNKAAQYLYTLYHAAAIDTLTGLVLAYQSLEQPENAQSAMTRLREFAWETNNPTYIAIARSCQAHLSLLQGNVIQASREMQAVDMTTDAGILFYWLEKPRLTQCRLFVAQGAETSLARAEERLDTLRHLAENNHNDLKTIEILLLQTMLYQQQERMDEATAVLNQAVIMANRGRYLRPFIEAGSELLKLLPHLPANAGTTPFIKTIQQEIASQNKQAPPSMRIEAEITHRQKEVLTLLAAGLSNQEIADKLYISTNTVKRHTAALYRKLDVNNRRQAVAKAKQFGLLATIPS